MDSEDWNSMYYDEQFTNPGASVVDQDLNSIQPLLEPIAGNIPGCRGLSNADSEARDQAYPEVSGILPPSRLSISCLPASCSSIAGASSSLASSTCNGQSPALSIQLAPPERRKIGRPKGTGKLVVHGPHRKRGRPLGTGYKQKQRALLGEGWDVAAQAARRPRGRPKKRTVPAEPVGVSVQFGKMIVPGTSSRLAGPIVPQALAVPSTNQPTPLAFVPSLPCTTITSAASLPSSAAGHQDQAEWHTHASPINSGPHCLIIPDEDPQRTVETPDEEGVINEGVGDGLGEEDDPLDDDDEADNEDVSTPPLLRKRRPLPSWLLHPFNVRREESKHRSANGLPPLYEIHHTFWFPQKSSWFILQQKTCSPPELYNPRFFLWDPDSLCRDGLPCPDCKNRLHRHGEISHPRRCVDINSTFWIIGYRYRCNHCVHPRTNKKTVTFRSWDPRVIAVLPPALAAEFPAQLSHRSGISNTLFSWMRSCFQTGMGSKQFSDAVRVQHLLSHDHLHLQYLQHLALRKLSLDKWTGQKYEAFLPFDDNSPRGRHGFVPSSQWFRDMYDGDIEQHEDEINQHTAMLPADVCSIDHSHKVTKHIARVEGEQVFSALLTVTNHLCQVRLCNFVATKAHSEFERSLNRMRASIHLYGHTEPGVFYTDLTSDRGFLEKCFPSLLQDVIPIEKYGHLESFELPLPPELEILPKNTVQSINDAVRSILDDVPQDDGFIVVGFDSEWNVEVSASGTVRSLGSTAVIQLAYQNRVYVLQISEMLTKKELPHQLKLLLLHPRILKVGRMVNSDLSRLRSACLSSSPFVGGLDLGKYAKDRCVITNISKTGLSDLCALILKKCLDKNVPERISEGWEDSILSPEQLRYAAKDAYASLCIYEALSRINVPQQLPAKPAPSTPVLLYSTDNTTIIARGEILLDYDGTVYDGVSVTPTRIVANISEVFVPGAIITSHNKRPLQSFGATPFCVVCLRTHLRIYDPETVLLHGLIPTQSESRPGQAAIHRAPCNSEVPASLEDSEAEDSLSIENLLSQDLSGTAIDPSRHIDPTSLSVGNDILGADPETWDHTIHTRVLKDIWHVFHMFYISATHGLRKQFTRELRDAIFIPDNADKVRINAWGATQSPPRTYETIRNTSPEWIRRRCKHVVPPPHILYPLVANVFRTYGPIIDPDSKKPLFSQDNWKTAKNVLDLIKNGYLSDPPGVPLYTVLGQDNKNGLPIYRCARGTNGTEGGVHTHIRSRLPKFGTSIRHIQASLLDFILRHNLLTGTYNSTGQHYRGHFSIWITNAIQEHLIALQDILVNPVHIGGWVNGNLYIQTTEVLGILPIPDDIRTLSGMAIYVPHASGDQKSRYLAEKQGTRKAILPIHTSAEKQLFHQLKNSDPAFSPRSGEPRWRDAVKIWNFKADKMDNVSYKLIEQLKTYYTKWKELSHVKEALSLSAEARQPLSRIIHDPGRSVRAPPVPERVLQPYVVETGFLDLSSVNIRAANMTSTSERLTIASVDMNVDPEPQSPTAIDRSTHTPMDVDPGPPAMPTASTLDLDPSHLDPCMRIEMNARQRVVNSISNAKARIVPRKTRTCRKCAKPGCPGSQKVSNCKNQCCDCMKIECRGRNPKRLHKTCTEGWD